MIKLLVGSVELETNFDGDRVYGVDIRVNRWLEQWLSADEARALLHSLTAARLIRLINAHRAAIETMQVWA